VLFCAYNVSYKQRCYSVKIRIPRLDDEETQEKPQNDDVAFEKINLKTWNMQAHIFYEDGQRKVQVDTQTDRETYLNLTSGWDADTYM